MLIKKLSPHLTALLAFVIFISVFSLTYFLIPSSTKQPTIPPPSQVFEKIENEVVPSSTISESKPKQKIIKPISIANTSTIETTPIISSPTITATNTTSTTISTIDTIPFTLQVLDTAINSETKSGTNVIDAMKKMQADNQITFSGREFPNLGFFISTINGQSEDRTQGLYWFLYVNDKSGNIGASQYIIKPNDKIEWRLKKSNF
ncbi:MAG: DUF4430 domain-containing protein [bacterium]|nr:DUF4430 domain-containing protein [bacterium]